VSSPIATLPLERAEDVFALRQTGRVAAAALGCDEADQVRFATALSELGREILVRQAKSSAHFTLADDGSLCVDIDRFPHSRGDTAIVGLDAARKLIGDVVVSEGGPDSTITIRLHNRDRLRTRASATALRDAIARSVAPRPLDEMRLENRDLIATLSELKAQQDQLLQLNEELEETNRGVMAMYGQLADELEETNRGVVALYAELDDKTVRLSEANEAKSRFLANVSHELRSPVNSILALVRLITDPEEDCISEAQRKQLSLIGSSGEELLRLVNQLLDLAKAESGRLEPDIVPVNIPALLADLRGSLRPLLRPGVQFEFDIGDLPVVHTDGTLLNQVLRNVLTNAVKFTPSGGIRLSAQQLGPHQIEISVCDTGIGIAPDQLERIFEEFYQIRGPLQADHKGTGLGLPYARRLTHIIGGEMSIESETGQGSTFTIRIPVQSQPLLRAPESPRQTSPHGARVNTILIVDDEDGFRTALRGMLQGLAGRIIEARGGREGLELLRSARPDLAFIDLRMPDLDGAALLSAMSADPVLRSIPAVIVTSAELKPALRRTLHGAAAILSKANLDRSSVARAIDEALGAAAGTQ
jgi:signal transduction histidine kinase/ActR/RegA family two-component response regulator